MQRMQQIQRLAEFVIFLFPEAAATFFQSTDVYSSPSPPPSSSPLSLFLSCFLAFLLSFHPSFCLSYSWLSLTSMGSNISSRFRPCVRTVSNFKNGGLLYKISRKSSWRSQKYCPIDLISTIQTLT